MNGNLLNTNVIVKVLRKDSGAISFLNSQSDIYIPVIAIGELLYVVQTDL